MGCGSSKSQVVGNIKSSAPMDNSFLNNSIKPILSPDITYQEHMSPDITYQEHMSPATLQEQEHLSPATLQEQEHLSPATLQEREIPSPTASINYHTYQHLSSQISETSNTLQTDICETSPQAREKVELNHVEAKLFNCQPLNGKHSVETLPASKDLNQNHIRMAVGENHREALESKANNCNHEGRLSKEIVADKEIDKTQKLTVESWRIMGGSEDSRENLEYELEHDESYYIDSIDDYWREDSEDNLIA